MAGETCGTAVCSSKVSWEGKKHTAFCWRVKGKSGAVGLEVVETRDGQEFRHGA